MSFWYSISATYRDNSICSRELKISEPSMAYTISTTMVSVSMSVAPNARVSSCTPSSMAMASTMVPVVTIPA